MTGTIVASLRLSETATVAGSPWKISAGRGDTMASCPVEVGLLSEPGPMMNGSTVAMLKQPTAATPRPTAATLPDVPSRWWATQYAPIAVPIPAKNKPSDVKTTGAGNDAWASSRAKPSTWRG